MLMRGSLGLVAGLLLLSGCDQSPIAASRSAAEVACLDRFSALTHLGAENVSTTDDDPDDDPDDNVADNGPAFRITTTGQFAIDFPPIANLSQPYRLRCTGDINQRLLTSIQIDGTLHRPAPGERWGF